MPQLDELRDVARADVLKKGRRAATLSRKPHSIEFAYAPEYLEAGGPDVATSLPPTPEPIVTHAPGALPPFFAGLLPEGRRITALRQATKTSADDELTLLLAVGGDVVGDVQVVPAGQNAVPIEPRVTTGAWEEIRFADLFAASVGTPDVIDRVAIPGIQDKVSARFINVPLVHADARFILKLDPPEFRHLVANEAFFLEAARRSGIECAEAEIVRDSTGAMGLLVRRFDRLPRQGGGIEMLAQEDACQVLRLYPADKYRTTSEKVVSGLAAICQSGPVAALTLFKQLGFAYLSCNGDAHAKNFSIRQLADGEWRVTPAYDVLTTHPYGDTTMALPINGRSREDIGRRDFLALGTAIGLRERAAARALDDLCQSVDLWIDDIEGLPFDERRCTKLRRAVEYRRQRVSGTRA